LEQISLNPSIYGIYPISAGEDVVGALKELLEALGQFPLKKRLIVFSELLELVAEDYSELRKENEFPAPYILSYIASEWPTIIPNAIVMKLRDKLLDPVFQKHCIADARKSNGANRWEESLCYYSVLLHIDSVTADKIFRIYTDLASGTDLELRLNSLRSAHSDLCIAATNSNE